MNEFNLEARLARTWMMAADCKAEYAVSNQTAATRHGEGGVCSPAGRVRELCATRRQRAMMLEAAVCSRGQRGLG